MPISKKSRIQREHRAAEKAGTRAPVKANGLPVKPPQPKSICQNCRAELISVRKGTMEEHALKHDQKKWPKEKCFPNDFPGTSAGDASKDQKTWTEEKYLQNDSPAENAGDAPSDLPAGSAGDAPSGDVADAAVLPS